MTSELTNQGKIVLDCLEIASKNSLSSILLTGLESIYVFLLLWIMGQPTKVEPWLNDRKLRLST